MVIEMSLKLIMILILRELKIYYVHKHRFRSAHM